MQTSTPNLSPTPTVAAIADILATAFHVEPERITPDATLESLGLDSLALMEFVFAAEDRFDVRIPEDRLDPQQAGITLATLAGLIDDAVAAKARAPADATAADDAGTG